VKNKSVSVYTCNAQDAVTDIDVKLQKKITEWKTAFEEEASNHDIARGEEELRKIEDAKRPIFSFLNKYRGRRNCIHVVFKGVENCYKWEPARTYRDPEGLGASFLSKDTYLKEATVFQKEHGIVNTTMLPTHQIKYDGQRKTYSFIIYGEAEYTISYCWQESDDHITAKPCTCTC